MPEQDVAMADAAAPAKDTGADAVDPAKEKETLLLAGVLVFIYWSFLMGMVACTFFSVLLYVSLPHSII